MTDRRRLAACLTILIALTILFGGVTQFRALNRQDVGFRNPLDGCGTTLTSGTLNACITAIGAGAETLMVTPGTWTISGNVTVPPNVQLHVAAGAVLSIAGGVTLSVNGPLHAPMMQIFSGTGNVFFGTGVGDINPLWFGAKFDDMTDDTAALSRTLTAASASSTIRRRIKLPAGVARFTTPLTIPADVSIHGEGQAVSILRKVGNIDGLLYAGAISTNWQASFQDFSVLGDVTNTGYLVKVQGQSWNTRFNRVRLSGTASSALVLHETVGVIFENGEISAFGQAAITNTAFANRITVSKNLFNHQQITSTLAVIDLHGVASWEIHGNGFQGGNDPPDTSTSVLRLDGVGGLSFRDNYAERYNGVLIQAHTLASSNINIRNNILHSFNPFKIMFELGALTHDEIHLEGNTFDGVSNISRLFDPGATLNYTFVNNRRGTLAEPLAYVVGYPADRKTVIKRNQDLFTSGISIGDWTRGLRLSSNTVELQNVQLGGSILLDAGAGGGVVRVAAAGNLAAQFTAEAGGGNLTRFFLWDVDRGALYQVKMGANNSGPGGVGRALVIDNSP